MRCSLFAVRFEKSIRNLIVHTHSSWLLYRYNVNEDQWTPQETQLVRYESTKVSEKDPSERYFIHAPFPPMRQFAQFWNPKEHLWGRASFPCCDLISSFSVTESENQLWISGGHGDSDWLNSLGRDCWTLNTTTLLWKKAAENLPCPRWDHTLVATTTPSNDGNDGNDGPIYLLGGRTDGKHPQQFHGPASRDCTRCSRVGGWWEACTPMIVPRIRPQAVSASDGKIYVFGGDERDRDEDDNDENKENEDNKTTDNWKQTAECYDPKTNMWTALPPFSRFADIKQAVALSDGRILLAGNTACYEFDIDTQIYSRVSDLPHEARDHKHLSAFLITSHS